VKRKPRYLVYRVLVTLPDPPRGFDCTQVPSSAVLIVTQETSRTAALAAAKTDLDAGHSSFIVKTED
jgi:hypothetical protein